ncbi:hypothetical protein ACFX2B_046122 [Malus domestica]
MVLLARIKIERFCGVKSLISSMKTPKSVEGKLVVFMIGGRLSTKHALCGREAWIEPWLTCLVERAPQKLVTKQWQFTRQELHQKIKLHHAWNILKDCSRWGTDVDQQWGRLFHSEAPSLTDVNESVNFADNESVEQMTPTSSFARPPGKDKQKEAKRKGKSKDPIHAQFASEMVRMNENHISRQEEFAQMHLAMKEQGNREQERFKINLMMDDPDKYALERKKYLRGKQNDIL